MAEFHQEEESELDRDMLVMQLAKQVQHLQQQNLRLHNEMKVMQVHISNN